MWPWPLTFRSDNLISTSSGSRMMWPDFGEIRGSSSYEDISFTRFFGSSPAVTSTFDLLTPKCNKHICDCEPKYICKKNWVKFSSLVFWDMVFTMFSGCIDSLTHSFTHGRTDPKYRMPPVPFFKRWRRHKKTCLHSRRISLSTDFGGIISDS